MTKLRLILFPLSIIYIFVTEIRNFLFRINVLKSKTYKLPIINVGNLSVGGTGKTPMVLWLAKLLTDANYSIAIISRGYGRTTKGFNWVEVSSLPENVGDEPLLFKQAYPNAIVAVCEKRTDAIDKILSEKNPDLIILDDAFQHQYVKPSLNILLSDYSRLFYTDFVLPAGNLRELRKNKSRADIIITSKSSDDLSKNEQSKIIAKLALKESQYSFFSGLKYDNLTSIFGDIQIEVTSLKDKKVVLVTGIAHADSIKSEIEKYSSPIHHFEYSDHYNYKQNDIDSILNEKSDIIITTSKDAVKLKAFKKLENENIYILSVSPNFNENEQISQLILNHVKENK